MLSNALETLAQDQEQAVNKATSEQIKKLVQPEQYVGEVYSINYESALVQIHDFHRQKVGGIPSLCFLVATRFQEGQDFKQEEASVLLLRVMDAGALPTDSEAERVRVESARRVSGESEQWDGENVMDAHTHNHLSFAGVKCRVIGTFFLEQKTGSSQSDDLVLRFGCDLSNYYPNRGLKVYKPNSDALRRIVNYLEPERAADEKTSRRVSLGVVRYASTNRAFQGVDNVAVGLLPADLLRQKTALFGMTRTGKSNTTKIILQSVFDLRFAGKNSPTTLRVGQIVFDPNGEYANENAQDKDVNGNFSAIKNIWTSNKGGKVEDVVIYGLTDHPSDTANQKRKLMLINFHEDAHLQTGKEIIDATLEGRSSIYQTNFKLVRFEAPEASDTSAMTRYRRQVLAYRALLVKSGFDASTTLVPDNKLFNEDLIKALEANQGANKAAYSSAAVTLKSRKPGESAPSWNQIANALKTLAEFMSEKDSGYQTFEDNYIKKSSSGDRWADDNFRNILKMFQYPDGSRLIGAAIPNHTNSIKTDYADDIYKDLEAGKLVIIDQSSGEPALNLSTSQRIMWHIFRQQQAKFRAAQEPSDIVVYAEEAHNLLPAGNDLDTNDVWVRTAKEGAKYNIGLVYATQEVSSIQRNILKNTANWFIGHLNNTDETKELCKFYDFADFEPSIRRAQDKGFLRVKTLSNLFVLPVQIKKFEVKPVQTTMISANLNGASANEISTNGDGN